jgi:hypothetical protein
MLVPLVEVGGAAGAAPPHQASAASADQVPLTAGQAKALSKNVTDKVIVVLKNQPSAAEINGPEAVARGRMLAAVQAPIVSELHQTAATNIHAYSLVDAVSATVSSGEAARLAANPAVQEVTPDVEVRGPDVTPARPTTAQGAPAAGTTDPIPPGACPAPGQPAYYGEELELINAVSNNPAQPTARSLGFTGTGVKVAYMAEGIDINNPDFIRPNGQHVFFDYQDFSGDGLNAPTTGGEAFLDASAIASQGDVYNVSHFSTVPLAGPCRVRVEGVAPGASLLGLKVFAQNGYSTTSGLVQAINYAVTIDHVNVINESFGYNPFPTTESQDLVEVFNNAAVAAGTTITVAAGDAGPNDTIGSPDTDPKVINVGASTQFRFYAETGTDGYQPPFATKGWLSDNISGLSTGGFAETGVTDDVIAPGDTSFAACTADVAMYADCTNFRGQPADLEFSGGTSESSPLTAGTAALVIQAYRSTHDGQTPTPALVKQIIVSTADDLGHPAQQQGSGIVDAYRAVLAAESAPADRTGPAQGNQWLLSTGQLHATGTPNKPVSLPLTITNVGTGPESLQLSTRTMSQPLDTQNRRVVLKNSGPTFFDNFYNAPVNYQITHFTVAPARTRLNVDITYKGNQTNSFLGNVDVVLIDPEGTYAADAVPQGVGNAASIAVRYPAPGKWTALIFSPISKDDGTVGPVLFQAQTFDFQPLGTVSKTHVTIPVGGSTTVKVSETTPATPGDEAASLVVAGPFGQTSTAAISLRSLIDLTTGGTFSGTLVGGNGRQPDLGQTEYYQFQVPGGETGKTLRADLLLADDQTDPVLAYLVDPDGQTQSLATNSLVTKLKTSGPTEVPDNAVEVAATSPKAGLWTLILNFTPTVTGNRIDEPFSGQVSLSAGPASGALPASASTVLAAGKPVTIPITVRNTSDAAQDYFVDARLDQTATLQLAGQSATTIPLPMPATADSPSWLVPADTSSITLTGEASVPLTFDWGPGIGDPDLGASSNGDTAMSTWTRNPVANGVWLADPSEIGPYGDNPGQSSTASLFATVQTQAFDSAVTAPTGDLWLQSIQPSSPVQVFTVDPGQTGVIRVTITPSAAAGTVVSGALYVDELGEISSLAANALNYEPGQAYFQAGTQVAALPYQYKVG